MHHALTQEDSLAIGRHEQHVRTRFDEAVECLSVLLVWEEFLVRRKTTGNVVRDRAEDHWAWSFELHHSRAVRVAAFVPPKAPKELAWVTVYSREDAYILPLELYLLYITPTVQTVFSCT